MMGRALDQSSQYVDEDTVAGWGGTNNEHPHQRILNHKSWKPLMEELRDLLVS